MNTAAIFKISTSATTVRPVGLVDIDFTELNMLPNDKHFTLKRALLNAYRELGIRDIYGFTNMDFKTMDSEHQHLLGGERVHTINPGRNSATNGEERVSCSRDDNSC
ncbi:hypothetical protein [Legionella brunensis]|uniref:Uncharacterized protein n=1 Tax=Legionella brunensis TaxID=29422 RepID=A0A0W0SUK3_9GAMM|nr:hypothetical protein [Legionella brunensis]KTC87064.1 hypothetical protein Lbru_0293 [Legionella brunensis]